MQKKRNGSVGGFTAFKRGLFVAVKERRLLIHHPQASISFN
jgi:hypothetical protein